jgi:hypothetical protein
MLPAMSQMVALLFVTQTAGPPACPPTAKLAETQLADIAAAHKPTQAAVQSGNYAPVSVALLGGTATHVVRQDSGGAFGGVGYLATVEYSFSGTLAAFRDRFLAAYPTAGSFRTTCTDGICTRKIADPADLHVDRIEGIVPRGSLSIASLRTDHRDASKVILSCMYRGR